MFADSLIMFQEILGFWQKFCHECGTNSAKELGLRIFIMLLVFASQDILGKRCQNINLIKVFWLIENKKMLLFITKPIDVDKHILIGFKDFTDHFVSEISLLNFKILRIKKYMFFLIHKQVWMYWMRLFLWLSKSQSIDFILVCQLLKLSHKWRIEVNTCIEYLMP